MRTILRISTLDGFASALLIAMGAAPLAACGDSEGGGGAGGDPTATTGATGATSSASTGASSASSGGTGGGASASASGSAGGTGGAGGAGVGGAGGAGGAGGTGGAGGAPDIGEPCADPVPVLFDGVDTGYDQCAAGNLRRREQLECPVQPQDDCCDPACGDGEVCFLTGPDCACLPTCQIDADCAPNQICMCGDGELPTYCVDATCATDADCGEGEACTSISDGDGDGCTHYAFLCTTPEDECRDDGDCVGSSWGWDCLTRVDGRRACSESMGCGRPYLIDDAARTAVSTARGDWSEGLPASVADLEAPLRAQLADAWTRIGLMEHASIAAFARFALQLLALGAPPELVERTHDAMRDETRHARLAFGLASAYGGAPVGPGPLALDGALGESIDVATFVRLTIREGCIGETVAALEAGEAMAGVEDATVKAVLAEIAHDERTHAELAWTTVRWAVDTFGDVARDAVAAELASALDELDRAAPGSSDSGRDTDAELSRHGLQTAAMRAFFARETLRRVIVPCLRSLLGDAPARRVAFATVDSVV
jgi:hypothetical protein